MRIVRQLILLLCLLSFLFACETKKPDGTRIPIIEVEGQFLYEDQLTTIVPANVNAEDSVQIVEGYIRKWATDILLYETAKRNVIDKSEIDKLLDDYRKSLIIHQYQQNILSQRLPQNPTEGELYEFYKEYPNQFRLKEAWVKGIFLVLPNGAPKIDQVKQWVKKADTESLEEIEKYSLQYGLSYDYFMDAWLPLNEILKKSSSEFESGYTVLQAGRLYEVSDSLKHYVLSVDSIKRVGDIEPFEQAKDKILYLMMNQRKSEFIRNFENELYRDAVRNGTISFFKRN